MDARDHDRHCLNRPEEEVDFPLIVVPDWDAQVKRAEKLCRLIDRHLDYEARGRLLTAADEFRPSYLCPGQRVALITDLYGGARPHRR